MPDGNGGSPLEELRSIIVGPEQSRIEELEERLKSVAPGAEEISRVLPAAISVSATRDDRLRNALAPLVEGTIHSSVRRNPQPLADAIFPIIGPAIRKAISAAMSGLVQTMNQALEHTFSIRGLRWRAESLRTGVSFGEIVLRADRVLVGHARHVEPRALQVRRHHDVVHLGDRGVIELARLLFRHLHHFFQRLRLE